MSLYESKLIFEKFESADFKYDNSFSEYYPKNTPSKAFLIPIIGTFILSQNFAIKKILGR